MKYRVLIDGADVSNIALVEGLEIVRNAHEAISTAHVRFQQRLDAGDKFAAREWKEWSSIVIEEAPGSYTSATPRRYWRLLVTSAATAGQPVSIEELEFFAPDGTSLAGGTPSASSSSSGNAPGNAFDANTATFWQSNAAPAAGAPQWIAYDFGAAVDVASLRVAYRSGNLPQAPGAFSVQWSSDGAAWSTVIAFTPDWAAADAFRRLSFVLRRRFAGYISEIQREAQDNEKFAVSVGAVGLAVALDRKVSASSFTVTSDREVVKALAAEAAAGLIIEDANIDFTATITEFDATDLMIREAMERLSEITGSRWHVDPNNAIHYYSPGFRFAPFNLSDAPDGVLSFPYQMRDFRREFSNSANRITLLGGIGEDGTEIRVTHDDAASIAEFGLLETITIDRQVSATAVADLKVQADLAQRALPRISGRALVRDPVEFWRLDLGQTIGIESALYGVDDNFVITGIREFVDRYTGAAFEIEYGAREADIVSTFRMLMRKPPALPQATISPGTVIPGENIVGTIGVPGQSVVMRAENVVGSFEATSVIVAGESIQGSIEGELVTVDAGTIHGVITGEDVQVSGQTITGVISGEDVEVHATVISGVIISDQLADQILDSLRLVGPGMAVVERIPAANPLPVLPQDDYPVGSTVLWSAIYGISTYGQARYGSTLYQNIGGIWTVASASGTITGTLRASDIESINATQINGLIIASQIQSINADQITGIIQAGQVGTIDAGQITGSIEAEQIGSIDAATITVGKIQASQVESIAAASITVGKIQASQIESIDANTITIGTLDADQIGSIDAETITINQVQHGQIGSVNAATITVGKINSDQLNATEIKVGGGGSKPGKFGVYNAGGTKIGFIGVEGSDEGIWASRGAFGGTGFADAVVKVIGTTYNMQISGASSTVQISTTSFDPSYSSIGMLVYDGSYRTWHVSRGIVLYAGTSTTLAAMVKSPTDDRGEIVLYTVGDAQGFIYCSGGVVRADRGFQVGALVGATGSVPYKRPDGSNGSMTFTGGLLTGAT